MGIMCQAKQVMEHLGVSSNTRFISSFPQMTGLAHPLDWDFCLWYYAQRDYQMSRSLTLPSSGLPYGS